MTVAELIAALQGVPTHLPVVIPGSGSQEGGYVNLKTVHYLSLATGVAGLEYADPEDNPGKDVILTLALD